MASGNDRRINLDAHFLSIRFIWRISRMPSPVFLHTSLNAVTGGAPVFIPVPVIVFFGKP